METKVWKVDKSVNKWNIYPHIQEAAELLKKNELVAFPTETVYGLGANALSDAAVQKIYDAKGRPSDNPLIIHIGNQDDVLKYAETVNDKAHKLMKHFWPGPLTIIFNKKEGVLCKTATADMDTVGIRMPDHPVALALLQACGLPIAAPSANISGKPSPTKFEHVFFDMEGKIAGIVDGGETGVGLESTVIDCTEDTPVILRPGGITKEEIEQLIGQVKVDPALLSEQSKPKSPGMKYKHYAPDASMYIVEGSKEYIQELAKQYEAENKKVGILTTDENLHFYSADAVLACGSRSDLSTVARHIYDVLREFDRRHVDIILSESFPFAGIGSAVMNRLLKAASYKVIAEDKNNPGIY